MSPLSSRKSFKPSTLFAQVRDALAAMRRVEAAPPRPLTVRRSIALEPLEPRLLLSADLTYAYNPADFVLGDSDHSNNSYTLKIEQNGTGLDQLALYGETSTSPIAVAALHSGLNTVDITGAVGVGDQLTIDMSGIGVTPDGLVNVGFDIKFDGKGAVPLSLSDDSTRIVGSSAYPISSLTLESMNDITVTGKVIASGDITLKSTAKDASGLSGIDGLLFTADSLITMGTAGAELRSTAGSISLLAESTITITDSNFSLGSVKAAFAIGLSSAAVNISNGVVHAGANLSVEAKSTVTSTLTTVPDDASDDNNTVDAAVASAILNSAATVTVSGGAVDAVSAAQFKATNTVTASSTADGLTGDQGGTVGFTLLTGDTKVLFTGGTVSAGSIALQATSDRTATTLAKATVGGSNDGGGSNESEKKLKDPNKDGNSSDKEIGRAHV